MAVARKTLRIKNFFSSIEFNEGENLLTTLNANKLGISQSCGGHGTCTTCRVFVLSGIESCSERTEIEAERAEERGFADNERLACQTYVWGNIEIELLNFDKE